LGTTVCYTVLGALLVLAYTDYRQAGGPDPGVLRFAAK
jgi:hypothetical protein